MRFGACFIYVYLPFDYDVYAHACWRFVIVDIPQPRPLDRLGPPSVGRRRCPSVPLAIEKEWEGCVRHAFPDTHRPSKQKTLMKR